MWEYFITLLASSVHNPTKQDITFQRMFTQEEASTYLNELQEYNVYDLHTVKVIGVINGSPHAVWTAEEFVVDYPVNHKENGSVPQSNSSTAEG